MPTGVLVQFTDEEPKSQTPTTLHPRRHLRQATWTLNCLKPTLNAAPKRPMRPISREESLSSGSPPSDVEHYDSATTFQLPKPVVENRIQALSERYGVPFYKRDPHMGLNECCRSIVSRANEESQSPVTCTLSLPDMNCVWALLRQAFCDKSVLPQLFFWCIESYISRVCWHGSDAAVLQGHAGASEIKGTPSYPSLSAWTPRRLQRANDHNDQHNHDHQKHHD